MIYQIATKTEKSRKKKSFERKGDCCGYVDLNGNFTKYEEKMLSSMC